MQTDRQQNEDDAVNEIKAWIRSLRDTEYDTEDEQAWQTFAKPLSAGIISARHSAFDRAGFRFEYADSPNLGTIWIGDDDLVKVKFSPAPALTHMALAYRGANWRGAGMWINGRAIDVPCDENGFPLGDSMGRWIDDDMFEAQIGVPDHPLTDWRVRDQLSELRGLLFVDAKTYKQMLVLPRDDERWPQPCTQRDGKQIRIYADEDAVASNRLARTVEF